MGEFPLNNGLIELSILIGMGLFFISTKDIQYVFNHPHSSGVLISSMYITESLTELYLMKHHTPIHTSTD
jgi:hypothetical protein